MTSWGLREARKLDTIAPSLLAVIAGTLGTMLRMKSADVRMTIKKWKDQGPLEK
ncbi:hypothetical protein PILCRDRAFT_814189 [Piloderma croceum F 1598]|uniref:Uncharacterized protein n=1 Tax=Piloderma croceum (strain F 1598) TaxID=765440 RepID=A0A0C3CEW7_PILCF|nr:hypothetical protein PILCRDRAFT_814189 [Piloderma croceum F 1598]